MSDLIEMASTASKNSKDGIEITATRIYDDTHKIEGQFQTVQFRVLWDFFNKME